MANIRDPRGQRQDNDNSNRDRHKDHEHEQEHPRPSPCDDDDDNCKDGKRPTDKSVQRERKKVCDALKTEVAELSGLEEIRYGNFHLYDDKKCCFVKTETNYQYYRNIELMVGVELMTVNDGIKDNVKAYKDWNKSLAEEIKKLVTALKEAKTKFTELKEAACKLNTCINDSCQSTQRKILIGDTYDNCKDNDNEVEDKCNSKEILQDLEELPVIFLHDINIIWNSAKRVAGIQVFSNVDNLEPLQVKLQEKSKAFDDFIQEKMKKGAEDLKKGQEDLTKSIQEFAKSTTGVYFHRSYYKGLRQTVDDVCECGCKCINNEGDENRLEDCRCQICDICDEVKTGVCKPEDNPVCRPRNKQGDHGHGQNQSY